jgi:predicted small integral membrane protein
MEIRFLKIFLVFIIASLFLILAGQNVANLDEAYGTFVYVLTGVDHDIYPSSVMPPISSHVLTWAALVLVVGFEFITGLIAARGALAMWSARNATAQEFQQSKKIALISCGLGMVIYLGFFNVLGGVLFQMWQTESGGAALEGAFHNFRTCALVFIIVSMKDK